MNHKTLWAFAISSVAVFMVTLDNLVVTTAVPVIRRDLHAGIGGLEWTVNAYTLTFAVLMLTGAALGDRYGRRKMFAVGMTVFTLSSAAAALAPSIGALIAARAVQGAGAAIIMPLSITLIASVTPLQKRGLGGPRGPPDAAAVAVPRPRLRQHEREHAGHGDRHVRDDLPVRPVPPVGPRLHPAGRGRPCAGVDRLARGVRGRRRAAGEPGRRAAADRGRRGPAGDRHRPARRAD